MDKGIISFNDVLKYFDYDQDWAWRHEDKELVESKYYDYFKESSTFPDEYVDVSMEDAMKEYFERIFINEDLDPGSRFRLVDGTNKNFTVSMFEKCNYTIENDWNSKIITVIDSSNKRNITYYFENMPLVLILGYILEKTLPNYVYG